MLNEMVTIGAKTPPPHCLFLLCTKLFSKDLLHVIVIPNLNKICTVTSEAHHSHMLSIQSLCQVFLFTLLYIVFNSTTDIQILIGH